MLCKKQTGDRNGTSEKPVAKDRRPCGFASLHNPVCRRDAGHGRCRADGVIIDLEHGAIDHESAHAMIAATAGTQCAPLVRIAQNDTALVKRALDLGAEGICFPLIRTAEDARQAVSSMRYLPRGTRGFGPFIAQSRCQTDMANIRADTEDKLVTMLLIETREAVENIEDICAVEGIDLLITAMFDLTTDLGVIGQFEHPEVKAAVEKVETAAFAAGIPLAAML